MARAVADKQGLKVLRCPTCGSVVGVQSHSELDLGNSVHRMATTFLCKSCLSRQEETRITWRPGEHPIEGAPNQERLE